MMTNFNTNYSEKRFCFGA